MFRAKSALLPLAPPCLLPHLNYFTRTQTHTHTPQTGLLRAKRSIFGKKHPQPHSGDR